MNTFTVGQGRSFENRQDPVRARSRGVATAARFIALAGGLYTTLGATGCVAEDRQMAGHDDAAAVPAAPTEAIDQRILERDGASFRDLSPAAAAQRAAYFQAMLPKTIERLPGSSQASAAALAPDGEGCLKRFDVFSNSGTAPGYTQEYGPQGPGKEGWEMHSVGTGGSSRLRFDYSFNDGSTPFTMIRAWLRGAPDDGKNSYVVLRDRTCADRSASIGCGDELDLVEYYGMRGAQRAEWTIYQPGNSSSNVGHGTYPANAYPNDPGHADLYSYTVYLEKGNYISLTVQAPNGATLGTWGRHRNQGYVPSNAMYLYAGIWDCSSVDPNHNFCSSPSGPYRGDSWFALEALYMATCQ